MQTALNPKPTDDPHDVLVVAPGVAVMVPTDEELSKLARSLRHPPFPQASTETDLPPAATVPPVDTTFRPAAVGDVRFPGQQTTTGGKAARALTAALVVAACTGGASIAWQSYGGAAEAMIARWAPQRVLAWLPLEKPAQDAQQPAPPAVDATAANAEPAQAGVAAQNAAEGVAPAAAASAETAPPLGSNELASARQEIEQLKATIEQLKAGQQQMSRDMAKASDARVSEAKVSSEVRGSEARMSEVRPSEQNLRPKMPAHPPRTAAVRARKPMLPPPLQQAATAPVLPQAAPLYVPRQVAPPPQTTGETLTDPELASVPRPPMPVR
ncbi:MAG: hypothetical protein ACXU9D_20185 [Xanthobacteraceae bacterium]